MTEINAKIVVIMMQDTTIIEQKTSYHIRSSTKHITILFTDIVDSTKYWDKFGDVQGRLMVDRHNRLLFPLVSKFKGRIIKTIGDSIMAAFAKPENALKAAVAMQQAMAMERQGDDTFHVHIRIGLHTGDAIVEREDVYGDCVNVAARVENVGKSDEILVSQATVAYVDDEYAFIFKRKGWFIPKGKSKKFYVYSCDWKNHPLLINEINNTSGFPLSKRRKVELAFYLSATLAMLYFIYLKYVRYLFTDTNDLVFLNLNPSDMLQTYPYLTVGISLIALLTVIIFIRMQTCPLGLLRLIKGGFISALVFSIGYVVVQYVPIDQQEKWNEVLESGYQYYVEVLENNSAVFTEPSLQGQVLKQMPAGQLLLQVEDKKIGDLEWNKVLLGAGQFGWIVQISPPQMGVPEKRISESYQFLFRYKDLYLFILAFLGFLLTMWKFRIRPI